MGIAINWYNDPYEEDARKRIKEIGQVAYDKEVAEYIAKQLPDNRSKSDPAVYRGDVICIWNDDKHEVQDEAWVTKIDNDGEKIVTYLDNRDCGRPAIWKGDYRKMASARIEKEEK